MMHEAEDEPLFAERAAGTGIAKAGIEVTVRVPSETRRGGRQRDTRAFRATRKDLLALADWLRVWGVAKIGMEPAGDYWKPVLFLLESEGLDCVLYHAAQVKALPGRPKTGKPGSAWLEATAAGERNPVTPAQLARGSMRGKIARLAEALDRSFVTEEHAAVLAMMLAAIDYYTAQIGELTAKIAVLCQPYEHQIAQPGAVPGTGVITDWDIIAEIGPA
jgi:transposase